MVELVRKKKKICQNVPTLILNTKKTKGISSFSAADPLVGTQGHLIPL